MPIKSNSVIAGKSLGMSQGCRPGFINKVSTLAGLVNEYEKSQKIAEKGWNPLRSLLEGYRGQGDLETVVKCAALAEDLIGKSYRKECSVKVKRHGHQRRIKQAVLQKAKQTLASKSNIEKLKYCKSFEDIFCVVSRNCSQIPGLGPLYIYDAALRIGSFLKKLPKRVYLHAGALAGARALRLDVKSSPFPVSAFPISMQQLTAHEIEDFLCIYKDELKEIKI
ncbi:MAG: hypothetical protein WCG52_09510 [bacterium]